MAELPEGEISPQALPHHIEIAVFTEKAIGACYGGKVDDAVMQSAGYRKDENLWWNPGLTQYYSKGAFYQPCSDGRPVWRVYQYYL